MAARVRAAQKGDRAAMERLVADFGPTVRSVALLVTKDPHDADDVVQETWLRVLTLIQQVREPERFAGWLRTTARREALRVVRERRQMRPLDDGHLDTICDPGPDPAEVVERRDRDGRSTAGDAGPADHAVATAHRDRG